MTAIRLTATSLFVLLLLSLPAHADSDGCYCSSKGYIAYELRAAIRLVLDPNGPALTVPHVLRIVRLSEGIEEQGEVAMEDFQVQELRCDADSVTIAGYGDKAWMKYTADIREPDAPRITEHIEEPFQQHPLVPGSPGPKQMRGFSPKETVIVISTDRQRTYQLVITHSEKAATSEIDARQPGFEYENRAEVRQLDSTGNVSERRLLYHDHFIEFGDYSQ
jgi:hypothetical protein